MTAFDALQPVDREPTVSIVAERIRQAILDGALQPGMQLGEVQLTQRLGVSRGPVREALQRLIQEGLLRNERHRGVFVVELGEEDIADIYLARSAIEQAAIRELLRRGETAVFSRLEHKLDRMEVAARKGKWASVVDLDLGFHEELVTATGSPRLVRMFRTLLAETRICLAGLKSTYAVWDDLVDEHRALLEAMRAGEEHSVIQLHEAHLEAAVRGLRHNGPGHGQPQPNVTP